jgi:hypothetical protein
MPRRFVIWLDRPGSDPARWGQTPPGGVRPRVIEGTRYLPGVLDVLQLRGDRIAAVTGFVTPEVFPSFGLPDSLPLVG